MVCKSIDGGRYWPIWEEQSKPAEEMGIKRNRGRWSQTQRKAFIKATNSRRREPRQARPGCSEPSNRCHPAPRWGLAREICRGHGSAKSEIMMSEWGKRNLRSRRICQRALQEKTWRGILSDIVINGADGGKNAIGRWQHGAGWDEPTAASRGGSSDQDSEGPEAPTDRTREEQGGFPTWMRKAERERVARQARGSRGEDAQRGCDLTQPKEGCRSGGPSVVEVPAKKWRRSPFPKGLRWEPEEDAKGSSGKDGPSVGQKDLFPFRHTFSFFLFTPLHIHF